jgi:Zn-dependent M28 family amino/carboxypeptidase
MKIQTDVEQQLQQNGLTIKKQEFTAVTPIGNIPMKNLIGIKPGSSNEILMLACHLESKYFDKNSKIRFLGANDSASACGLILELVPQLLKIVSHHTLWVVFFDGEEAFKVWSDQDSLYGSRQLASELKSSNLNSAIKAMILLDMIGDKELNIANELNSDLGLTNLVRTILNEKGWSSHFFQYSVSLSDDHIPFRNLGIPALDLIDFQYGKPFDSHHKPYDGAGSYFHNDKDGIDKIAAKSLEIVGETVLELFRRLDHKGAEPLP